MSTELPLQHSVLPALMRDDKAELRAEDLARQGHEVLCGRELQELLRSEVVWPLWPGRERPGDEVFGDALQLVKQSEVHHLESQNGLENQLYQNP